MGQGTTFEVMLPLLVSDEAEEVSASKVWPHTGQEHVLLVDDEPGLALLGKKALEALGYRVTSATDPREAFDIFKAAPDDFSILVSDQSMPGMTGDALACRVMELRPGFPVIICTGYSETLDEEKALSLGIKAMLMKPMDLVTLSKTIRRTLEN